MSGAIRQAHCRRFALRNAGNFPRSGAFLWPPEGWLAFFSAERIVNVHMQFVRYGCKTDKS